MKEYLIISKMSYRIKDNLLLIINGRTVWIICNYACRCSNNINANCLILIKYRMLG